MTMRNGVLETYLYDCYCAHRGGTTSTGSRRRDGYRAVGGVGTTNLYLEPGGSAPEELLRSVDHGFLVTEVLGLFAAIDPASGDFSIPSSGFMIEGGEIASPVRGVSIGGNLFELLHSVTCVGSDLTWHGAIGCPTVAVESVKLGGGEG